MWTLPSTYLGVKSAFFVYMPNVHRTGAYMNTHRHIHVRPDRLPFTFVRRSAPCARLASVAPNDTIETNSPLLQSSAHRGTRHNGPLSVATHQLARLRVLAHVPRVSVSRLQAAGCPYYTHTHTLTRTPGSRSIIEALTEMRLYRSLKYGYTSRATRTRVHAESA